MSVVDRIPAPADVASAPGGGPRRGGGLLDRGILAHATLDAVRKLDPRVQVKNPVMFVVLIGTVVTLVESIAHPGVFTWSITAWLALTVLFANFAEAVAEGRGKAQADTLRKMRSDTLARRLGPDGTEDLVPAAGLRPGGPGRAARPATSSPPTARSSTGSRRSTSRRSRASPPR